MEQRLYFILRYLATDGFAFPSFFLSPLLWLPDELNTFTCYDFAWSTTSERVSTNTPSHSEACLWFELGSYSQQGGEPTTTRVRTQVLTVASPVLNYTELSNYPTFPSLSPLTGRVT